MLKDKIDGLEILQARELDNKVRKRMCSDEWRERMEQRNQNQAWELVRPRRESGCAKIFFAGIVISALALFSSCALRPDRTATQMHWDNMWLEDAVDEEKVRRDFRNEENVLLQDYNYFRRGGRRLYKVTPHHPAAEME